MNLLFQKHILKILKKEIFLGSINKTSSPEETTNKQTSIYTSLEKNIEFMKVAYNSLINNDIVIRNFTLIAYGKKFDAFILFIDGMSDTNLINNFVLKPLMLKNDSNTSNLTSKTLIKENGKTIIKKGKKMIYQIIF